VRKRTLEADAELLTRLLQRPVGADKEEGSNWVRWGLSPAETGCGSHRDCRASLDEIFKKFENFHIFEKSKNAGNSLISAQNQNFLKNSNVKFFKFFWFCALVGQFPAFFVF
jgi:hypothetical protein